VRGEYRSLFPASAPGTSTKGGREALLKAFVAQLDEWKDMLQRFLKGDDDQVGWRLPACPSALEPHQPAPDCQTHHTT
jgi:hypothetical protein